MLDSLIMANAFFPIFAADWLAGGPAAEQSDRNRAGDAKNTRKYRR